MELNGIKPAAGSKRAKHRVARGIGASLHAAAHQVREVAAVRFND